MKKQKINAVIKYIGVLIIICVLYGYVLLNTPSVVEKNGIPFAVHEFFYLLIFLVIGFIFYDILRGVRK